MTCDASAVDEAITVTDNDSLLPALFQHPRSLSAEAIRAMAAGPKPAGPRVAHDAC
jgi:hypothetical protein